MAEPAPSGKLHFEQLEPRVLLSADIWSVAFATDLAGASGFYTLEVVDVAAPGEGQLFRIYDTNETTKLVERNFSEDLQIQIEGTAGSDVLRILMGANVNLFFQVGVSFAGGGGEDRLEVDAGFDTAEVDAALGRLLLSHSGQDAEITFEDVEAIRLNGAMSTIAYLATDADETIALGNLTGEGNNGFTQLSVSGAAPNLEFRNPSAALRIAGAGGDDTIQLNAPDATFEAALSLVFADDWGNDTITVNDYTDPVTLDFTDHSGVVSAELRADGTLTIVADDDFEAPANSVTIANADIPNLRLAGAEFDLAGGGEEIAKAIQALRAHVATVLDEIGGLANDERLDTALPLLQQVVDFGGETFAVGATLGELLRLVDALEKLQQHIAGFADSVDDLTALPDGFLNNGPLSLQLAQHLVDLSAAVPFDLPSEPDSPLATLGQLALALSAVRLMPQRTGSAISAYTVEIDVEASVASTFKLDLGAEASIAGVKLRGTLPDITVGAQVLGTIGFTAANLTGTPTLALSDDTSLELGATFDASGIDLGINLGFLDAAIVDGTIAAELGVSIAKGDSGFEVEAGAAELDVELPFAVNVSLFNDSNIFGPLTGGAHGVLQITLDDVFSGRAPEISAELPALDEIRDAYDLLSGFSLTSPGDVYGMFEQFLSLMEQVSVSDLLTAEIPLLNKRLSEVLPFAKAIEDVLLGPLAEIDANGLQSFLFENVQSLVARINAEFGQDIVGIDFTFPSADTPPALYLTIAWEQSFSSIDIFGVDGIPVAFDFALGDLGSISVRPAGLDADDIAIPPKLDIEIDLSFDFTFGIELAPGAELFLGFPLYVSTPSADLTGQGRLTESASFSFNLYDRIRVQAVDSEGELVFAENGDPVYELNAEGKPLIRLDPLSSSPIEISLASSVSNNNIAAGPIILRSVATAAGGGTTLTDTEGGFDTLLPVAIGTETVFVRITSGTGAGQLRQITGFTATTLTVNTAWGTALDSTSRYEIVTGERTAAGSIDSATTTTITSTGANFNSRLNPSGTYYVEIIDGAQRGQIREIASWTADTITLATALPGAPGVQAGNAGRFQIYLGNPVKTLQHDLQQAINTALHNARNDVPENTDTQLKPGDVVINWTGTRFVLESPATRLVTQDLDTLIQTTRIVDRVLAFQGFNEVAKSQLGLLSSPLRFDGRFTDPANPEGALDAEFKVRVDGDVFTVKVDGAETLDNESIDDLIVQMNEALEAAFKTDLGDEDGAALAEKVKFVRQSLNGFADGNRIALKGEGIGRLEMFLPEGTAPDSTTNAAVVHLGLTEAVSARGLATEFFIRGAWNDTESAFDPAGFSAEVKLTLDELIFDATLGFLGVEVELTEPGTITAGFDLNIVDPTTGGGRVLVPDLWGELSAGRFFWNPADGVAAATGFLQPVLSFDGQFALEARLAGAAGDLANDISAALGIDPKIGLVLGFGLSETEKVSDFDAGTFAYNVELGRVSALDLGYLFVQAELTTPIDEILDLFSSFRNLSVADILALINNAVDFVTNLDGALGSVASDIFDFELPLVNVSLRDTLDFAEDFARTLDAILANPASSIQDLEDALREALGLDPLGPDGLRPSESGRPGFDFALSYDAENDALDPALRFDLTFGFGFNETLPIDLDVMELLALAGFDMSDLGGFSLTELLGLAGSGGLTLSGGGTLNLAMGLPLLTPQRLQVAQPTELLPFVYLGEESTGLEFFLDITGENLTFEARVLTLGIFVRDGEGSLDANFKLFLDKMENGTDRLTFDALFGDGDVSIADLVKTSFGGSGELTLPLYFPTENRHIFDLGVRIPSMAQLVNHLFGTTLPLEAGLASEDIGRIVVVTPDDILSRFTFSPPSLLDLLLDPGQLIDGLELGLDYLEDALRGQILGIDLPLIGDALAPAADFIDDFRGRFLTPLTSQILLGLNEHETTAHMLHDLLYRIFSDEGDPITAFGKQFGQLDLLQAWDGGAVSKSDVRVKGVYDNTGADDYSGWEFDEDADFIQFEWVLGGTIADLDVPTGFDIGIPGLGLALNADINLGVTWELVFGFGIDAKTGFYIVTFDDRDTATIEATATLKPTGAGDTIEGTLGFLKLTADDYEDDDGVSTNLTASFAINLKDPKPADQQNNRITFRDLTSRSTKLADLVSATLTGGANVRLAATVDFGGFDDLGIDLPVSSLPAVDFNFEMDWEFGTFQFFNGGGKLGGAPQVYINDITLDLGSFISDFAGPILDVFAEILGPLEWLIGPDGLLNQRIPILSDLAGTTITLKTLAEAFDQNAKITPFLELAEEIFGLIKLIDDARTQAQNAPGGGLKLNFGSIHLNTLFGDGDLRDVGSLQGFDQAAFDNLVTGAGNALNDVNFDGAASSKQFTNTLTKGKAAFHFPILSPAAIFQLILGADDVDLVQIDLPELVFGFEYRQVFQVFGPLAATLRGAFSATIDIGLGYDTFGLANFRTTGNALDLIDGFYFSTVDFTTGERKPALTLRGEIAAGAALSLGVATAGVEGGIAATIYFDWNDPNKDTKVRIKEMIGNVEANFPTLGPLAVMSVFDITGVIEWFFKAFVEVNLLFFKFSKSWDLGGGVIAEFEIPFVRQGVLGTKSGDTLTLNIGPNAASRVQGNIIDGDEQIYVRTIGVNDADGSVNVAVWSPQFNVSYGNPQVYNGIRKIVGNGGAGNDLIDMTGVTHAVEVDIDGGAGNDTIRLGTPGGTASNATGTIRGGSGNDTIAVNAARITVDGGAGYDTITAAARSNSTTSLDPGVGGGSVTMLGGTAGAVVEHVIDAGVNVLNLSGAAAGTTHRVVFEETIGASNTITGKSDATSKTILDFSKVRSNVIFSLTATGIVAEWGSNRVNIDTNVDLVIGGRGGDVFNVYGTRAAGIELDGGKGADAYYVYAWNGEGTMPDLNLRLRDTGTDAWNNDELYIIGSANNDDITVRERADDHVVELAYGPGQTQTVSYFNKAGPVQNGALVTQLTVEHEVPRDAASMSDATLPLGTRLEPVFTDANLPAGIAKLIIEGRGGDDVIKLESTPAQMGVLVEGGVGDDTVVVGAGVFNAWGETAVNPALAGNLSNIRADATQGGLRMVGGTGSNTLVVDDSLNVLSRTGMVQTSQTELGWMEVLGLGMGAALEFVEFSDLEMRLGTGGDWLDVLSTLYLDQSGQYDALSALRVYGGAGNDFLNLHDSEPGTLVSLFGDYPVDVMADNDGTNTGPGGSDIINIFATRGLTTVYGGPGGDAVNIHSIAAETVVYGGTGDDRMHVGVLIDAITGFLIDARTPVLFVSNGDGQTLNPDLFEDGSAFRATQLILIDPLTGKRTDDASRTGVIASNGENLIGAELTLNGQDGTDAYFIFLGGNGRADINVFDTGASGGDTLNVYGTAGDDLFLLRAGITDDNDIGLGKEGRIGFVALFNDGRDSAREQVERINYSRDLNENTGINGGITVDGRGGYGQFYVDDNLGPTTLIGAEGGNYFQFGQLYNSERVSDGFTGLVLEDAFYTVETTRGWLSRGISFDLTAIGAELNANEFVVLNNQATLNLYGGEANDRFVVRSFALVGSVDPQRENIDISTGGGENYIEYVVGAPVNIDGGGGFNTLVVIGTEFADDYVITEDGIFGAGRLVNFVNIQQLEVDGAEGNDRFFVLGTAPGTSVIISGGLGSDAVFIGGETPDIISRDLKGHSGIISHSVISADGTWNGIKVDEISANVADNDEAGIVVTQRGGNTTLVSSAIRDSYGIVLTRAPAPGATVTVTVSMSPRPVKVDEDAPRELRPFVYFADSENGVYDEILELTFDSTNWNVEREVWIETASDQPFSGIVSGFVAHDIAGDRVTGTSSSAIRVVGQAPNQLIDTTANFGADDSLRGAIVEIVDGKGLGQQRVVIGNTATSLTLDKPWVLDPVAVGASGDPDNQSGYQIRLYEGLAIPAVQVKAYFADFGAAILEPGGGVQVIEQAGTPAWDATLPFTGSYQLVLTQAPAGDVTIDLAPQDGVLLADVSGNAITSVTFTALNWYTPQTVLVAAVADGVAQKARTLEIGHAIGGQALETLFVRVIDGDTPSVIITESDGHTSVIEGGELGAADVFGTAPFVDSYSVVLSQQPDADVEIWVRAEGTRTTKGNLVNFGEQVELAVLDGGAYVSHALDGTQVTGAGTLVRLVFTSDNWNVAQTVYVQALDDDVVDGGDTKVFGTRADETSRIQGPLDIRGGGGQGSLVGLPVALLFPDDETNDYRAIGTVQVDAAALASSVVVAADDLAAFIVRYGLDFGLGDLQPIHDALIGLTFRLIEGENGTEFDRRFTPQPNSDAPPAFTTLEEFDPFDPELQLLIPFREIVGWEWADQDAGLIRLLFPEELPWVYGISTGDDYVLINASPANFFAREEEQVDLLFVRDTDASTDEEGRLIFHTEEPLDAQGDPLYDVSLENRGQLIGLGMGPARTIGLGGDAVRLPAGIVFDEIEMLDIMLGSGSDRFVVESTHSGSTRIHTGAGDDTVEVWTASGPVSVIGGSGDNTVHAGLPGEGDLHSLAQIAALLTVAGNVPEADARITVRGEPDVLAQDNSVLAQGSTNEQEIFLRNADGGTFTLRFKGAVTDAAQQSPVGQETGAIAYGASAEDIRLALEALDTIAPGDLTVERFGDRIVVRFAATGAWAKTPMHTFGVSSTGLTSSGQSTLNIHGTGDVGSIWALLTQTTLTGMGMPVFNAIQTVYLDDPLPGEANRAFSLSFGDESTGALDRDMTAAQIQSALEGLDSVGTGNVAVTKADRVIVVRFQGALTNTAVPSLTTDADWVHIATREAGIDPLADPNIPPSADAQARNDIQTLTIDATGGSFVLGLDILGQTGPIAHNATAAEVREALQRLLPNRFADDIAVQRFGGVYHIAFQGLLRQVMGGEGVGFLTVDTDDLAGSAALDTRMDGVNYYGIDTLNIAFGPADAEGSGHVLNVQGSNAATTNINLNSGDDRIFISSLADLDLNTLRPDGAAYGFDFLPGHLDLILGDVNIDAGAGRHQLMISDEATQTAKTVSIGADGGTAAAHTLLDHVEIAIEGWAGGAIRFGAASDANFFDGITLWGGAQGNAFDVSATHYRSSEDWRTQTTLNAGKGDDTAHVNLQAGLHGFFVLNAQSGDDRIDASASTLPLILFGGAGDDVILGGQGGDLIFGDEGRIVYLDPISGTPVTVLGHGGRYDFTDGRRLPPSAMFSVNPLVTGDNRIMGGAGADLIVGGFGNNWIYAGAGDDIAIGDGAWIEFETLRPGWVEIDEVVPVYLESVFDTDQLDVGDGTGRAWSFGIDPLLGGHTGLIAGGTDVVLGGDGDDVVIGGSNSDILDGDDGRVDRQTGAILSDTTGEERNRDLVIGDNAIIDRRGAELDIFTNPRFRALTGSEIYDTGLHAAGDLLIDRQNAYADPDWNGTLPAWSNWVLALHDGLTHYAGWQDVRAGDYDVGAVLAPDAASTRGDNYLAGGRDADMIFGQRGANAIQGDGSIFFDIWTGDWISTTDGQFTAEAFGSLHTDGVAALGLWEALEASRLGALEDGQITRLPQSFEAADDGDDYIEGGAGNDVILGNLGQNDIIGGSSNQFGLTEAWQRDDSGANILFGGAGTRIDRNDEGFGDLVAFADRHARNASVILGDNGNIFRLIGTDGTDGGAHLNYSYDVNDPTREGGERIKVRGVDLLDYQRWELAPETDVPEHLGFNGAIGAGDLIHGESGDDVIFGMGGDNVIFGHAGDDLIVGGFGNNWISGGTGDDGILGDDGIMQISRNGFAEPLFGIVAHQQTDISNPGGLWVARLYTEGEIRHQARLFGFTYETGGNDIIYGGLGNDSIHAGAGDDAVSGAEALPGYFTGALNWLMKLTQNQTGDEGLAPEAWFYRVGPYNPGDILQYTGQEGLWFRLYNEIDPLRMMLLDGSGNRAEAATVEIAWKDDSGDLGDIFNVDLKNTQFTDPSTGAPLYQFFLNFDPTEGPRDTRFPDDLTKNAEGLPSDGDDVIFGNLGNNWIVGGTGRDHMWGGWGDNVLNADDNHLSTLFDADPLANDVEDPFQSYADIVMGGAGRDVLIGNTGADRLIDWIGEFNTYVVPFSPFGGLHIWRLAPSPNVLDFLLQLSRADGADQLLGLERGGDPDRQGEPMGEIALVTREDDAWGDQSGGPAKPFPDRYGGQRELMWRALPGEAAGPGGGGGNTGGRNTGGGNNTGGGIGNPNAGQDNSSAPGQQSLSDNDIFLLFDLDGTETSADPAAVSDAGLIDPRPPAPLDEEDWLLDGFDTDSDDDEGQAFVLVDIDLLEVPVWVSPVNTNPAGKVTDWPQASGR